MLTDYEYNKKLCFSSFEQYGTRLNWNVADEKILGHIEELLEKRKNKCPNSQ